jgi:predicted dehydrogenase
MRNYPVITDRKIRLALVGCGRISANHFGAMEQHADRVEIVDVCDVDPMALDRAVKRTAAKGHSMSLPKSPWPRAGKMPLRMVRACDEAHARLFVVKQNRRNSTLQLLKRAVDEKRFGRIYMVNINVFWTRPQEYYDSAKWRGTWELDGGAFMNQASHYVDLLDWLIGPVAEHPGHDRHARTRHPGRRHRRAQCPLAQRGARLDERHHAYLPEESRRQHHHPGRKGHGAHRRSRSTKSSIGSTTSSNGSSKHA